VLSGCTEYAALPLDRSTLLKSDVGSLRHTGYALPPRLGADDIGRLAVENNPDLIAARTQRGVAEAQVLQAGILPNPIDALHRQQQTHRRDLDLYSASHPKSWCRSITG
jgi:hypothetical protein